MFAKKTNRKEKKNCPAEATKLFKLQIKFHNQDILKINENQVPSCELLMVDRPKTIVY